MKAYEKLQQFMREKHGQPDWETAWRDLLELTDGITKIDPRFQVVRNALEKCDKYFEHFMSAVPVMRPPAGRAAECPLLMQLSAAISPWLIRSVALARRCRQREPSTQVVRAAA